MLRENTGCKQSKRVFIRALEIERYHRVTLISLLVC